MVRDFDFLYVGGIKYRVRFTTTTTIFSVFSIYSVVTKIYRCENKDITNSPRAVHTCDTLRKHCTKKKKEKRK